MCKCRVYVNAHVFVCCVFVLTICPYPVCSPLCVHLCVFTFSPAVCTPTAYHLSGIAGTYICTCTCVDMGMGTTRMDISMCMYVCSFVLSVRVCVRVRVRVWVCVYVPWCCLCQHEGIYTHPHRRYAVYTHFPATCPMCMCICMCISVRICVCVCVCFVYMYVYMCLYLYVNAHECVCSFCGHQLHSCRLHSCDMTHSYASYMQHHLCKCAT